MLTELEEAGGTRPEARGSWQKTSSDARYSNSNRCCIGGGSKTHVGGFNALGGTWENGGAAANLLSTTMLRLACLSGGGVGGSTLATQVWQPKPTTHNANMSQRKTCKKPGRPS